MNEAQSSRMEGFLAAREVRGIQFSIQGTAVTFTAILAPVVPVGVDARDPSTLIRAAREIHVLRSDIASISTVTNGAIFVSDSGAKYTSSGISSSKDDVVLVIQCSEEGL